MQAVVTVVRVVHKTPIVLLISLFAIESSIVNRCVYCFFYRARIEAARSNVSGNTHDEIGDSGGL